MVEDDTHPPGYFVPRRSELQIAILQQQVESLRAFIDLKLDTTRELLDARWQADLKAVVHAAEELSHRLSVLNDAHEEARRVARTTVEKAVFDLKMVEIERRQEENTKKQEEHILRLTTLETSIGARADSSTRHFSRAQWIVAVILSLPGIILGVILLVSKLTT